MLAIFQKTVAQGPPELKSVNGGEANSSSERILESFKEAHPQHTVMQFDDEHTLAITSDRKSLRHPRQFSCCDEVFCSFTGCIGNLPALRQMYGITRAVSEVQLCIEAYKTLRDRAPYPADRVVGDLEGSFAFIMYDYAHKSIFVAADAQGHVPLYWGMCAGDALMFSDDASVLRAACGKNFAPFPRGCYFSSAKGLSSFEHPLNELKPIPHIDSQGQMCGATFKADTASQIQARIKHSGSDFQLA